MAAIGVVALQIAGPERAGHEGSGAGEGLLAVGGHDGLAGAATGGGIAPAAPMLLDEPDALAGVLARQRRNGTDDDLDVITGADAEHAEAEPAAEVAEAAVTLATLAGCGDAGGDPHLVALGLPVHGLQHQF